MAQQPTVMPQDMMPQPHPHPQAMHPPVNSYYPENPNDLTGGLPINLDSLRDGPPGSKPFYPYSTLIRCILARLAILSVLKLTDRVYCAVTRLRVHQTRSCF